MNSTNDPSRAEPQAPAELLDLVPDYLNGHLPAAEQATFEDALAHSEVLKEELRFEQGLQVALRAEATAANETAALATVPAGTGFAAIADQLVEPRRRRWLDALARWWRGDSVRSGAPAFALLLIAGVIGGGAFVTQQPPVQEFETRIGVEHHSAPTLRVLPRLDVESGAFEDLLTEYGLQLEQILPDGSNMADVTLAIEDGDLERIAEALRNDSRVLLTKMVASGPSHAVKPVAEETQQR